MDEKQWMVVVCGGGWERIEEAELYFRVLAASISVQYCRPCACASQSLALVFETLSTTPFGCLFVVDDGDDQHLHMEHASNTGLMSGDAKKARCGDLPRVYRETGACRYPRLIAKPSTPRSLCAKSAR